MSAPVRMFGYLRPHSSLKAHEIAGASDEQVAEAVVWSTHDWRDDPEWVCVAIGEISMQRLPTDTFVAQAVANLRQQQQDLRAAAEIKSREIEQQINSLLAITHEPSGADVTA